MFAILDNEWDLADITGMVLRKVNFAGDGPQVTTTTLLRLAWTHLPPSPESSDIETVMRGNGQQTPEEKFGDAPKNPDTAALHTPWRDKAYYLWNHLFWDVSRFMNSMYGVGHLHPPNQDVFGLEFPRPHGNELNENVRVFTKIWECNVLVLPAFLAPSVVVRVETYSPGEEGGVVRDVVKLRGKFGPENPAEIWYMRKGLETRFYIEGDWERPSTGLAAAMVYGKLCDDTHGNEQESEEESEEEESD
ncbi:hypothetical protein NUU61_003947 [Penicillium alfredii]|uniref:Uncharacterized protein n=1 Tax=Penicillium alfredii TaxID=1506179 RepID=A0A9W9FK98_9EURO|nr:uncharacterized protein NUU61_003947 [Penicillium alfredii]KAJ5101725.1 hypothetical protein NUU61_003947 [Penicillium alfredii]